MRTVIAIVSVVVICIATLLTWQFYHPDPPPRVEYVEQIRYLPSDTIPRPYPVRVPVPVYIDTHQLRPQAIDTGAIIARYLERVAYTDTAINDTSALVVIADTLQHNRIVSRAVTFQNRLPRVTRTITHTITNQPPAWRYGFGIRYHPADGTIHPVAGVIYKNIQIEASTNDATLLFVF